MAHHDEDVVKFVYVLLFARGRIRSRPSTRLAHPVHRGGGIGGRRLSRPRGLGLAGPVHLLDLAHGVLVHGARVGREVRGRGAGDCYGELLLGGHDVLWTTRAVAKKGRCPLKWRAVEARVVPVMEGREGFGRGR